MSKKNCELIKDLLPLYVDNVCSEESRKMINEHLAECKNCCSELEKMQADITVKEKAKDDIKSIKKIKKRFFIGKIIAGIVGAFLLYSFIIFGLFFSVNGYRAMNYEKNQLDKNLYVEEDETGRVWLVKDACATEGIMDYSLRASGSDVKTAGPYLAPHYKLPVTSENVRDAEKIDLVITLAERNYEHFIDNLFFEVMVSRRKESISSELTKERVLLIDPENTKNKAGAIYYYDIENDKEYLLWEKK